MDLITLRQSWALIRRYFITLYRSPFKSLIRCFIFPGAILGLILYFLINNQDSELTKNMQIENYIEFLVLMLTGFQLWSFTEYLVTDKVTFMKSLMISMGLKRSSYYLGNSCNFAIFVLPITITIAVISVIYVFVEIQTARILIILVFLLFTLQLIGFAFLLASIITSTGFVSILALYLLLETFFHQLVLISLGRTEAWWHPILLFIYSISPYESINILSGSYTLCKNACSSTKFDSTALKVGQPIYLTMMTQIFWSLIMIAAARWLEEVCPWQIDTAIKGPLFCFKSINSESQEVLDHHESSHQANNKYFESNNERNREIGIQIRNVSKSFRNLPAVSDLSFNIYKGETTLLLGHNGAGKTTLMNIILGKLEQDRGHVAIKRSSVRCIGVCPQTSIYDANLSVAQHLELFFDIKYSQMSSDARKMHIRTTINDVSLERHDKKVPSELSGGMLRKLSLAMAFVGKSDVLILDEPSSGLDPDSRVFIWDAIRRYRADRTVLLSTQHMEEADYLGDRIAIMAEGKIICCGSSIFLNNVLGNCYKLRVEYDKTKQNEILALVRKYFISAKLSNSSLSPDSAQEMVIELIDDKTKDLEKRLIDLLEYIENNNSSVHGIRSYGLKSSSIEDVMLNTSKVHQDSSHQNVAVSISPAGNIEKLSRYIIAPDRGFFAHQKSILYALLIKQFQTYRSDWKSLIFFRLLLPLLALYSLVNDFDSIKLAYSPQASHAFLVIHYIHYPTMERVSKFKTMQLTSFTNPNTYWLSHIMSDVVSIILVALYAVMMNMMLFDGIYVASQLTFYTILVTSLILCGISAALIAYILSNIMGDLKTCTGYFLLTLASSTFVYVILQIVQMTVPKTDLSKLLKGAQYLFIAIFPTDALQYIAYGLNTQCYIRRFDGICLKLEDVSPVLIGFIVLAIQIFTYSSILYYIEAMNIDLSWYFKYQNVISCIKTNTRAHVVERSQLDEDVLTESAKTQQAIKNPPHGAYSLIASNLSKSYIHGIKVIDHLSFAVNKGECFGLLGVNGAGKSTTFSMIAAESVPDDGKIWIEGSEQFEHYRKKLGYDPQSNPETHLTAIQTLYLMARLRRITEQSIPMLVHAMLELLQMEEHSYKTVGELSGGTKRKLTLGMSLIGNPAFVALDEPTAGVDPIARVDIWTLLRSLRTYNKTSIVISSHAMEECEAVCDRIAIMARGKLRCIGTFLHLRSRFSQGGRLKVQFVKTATGNKNLSPEGDDKKIVKELEQRLTGSFGPSIKLVDSNLNGATFNIADNRVRRSAIMKMLREFRKIYPNIHYILNDASLEDIFIALAREEQELNKTH